MASLIRLLNRLLPFATPGTPLVQDLVHLASICTLLYFAPQIQEWVQQRQHRNDNTLRGDDHANQNIATAAAAQQDVLNEEIRDDHAQVHDEPLAQPPNPPAQDPPQLDFAEDGMQEGEAGPANGRAVQQQHQHQEAAGSTQTRNVGAKKAKSLARKDQRRAYHEFQRSQGDMQRAREAAGAAEREAQLAQERARRKAIEDEITAEKAREVARRKEIEAREREEEHRRRELVVSLVRQGLQSDRMVDLFKVARMVRDDVDEEWVEKIVKAAPGLLGKTEEHLVMITSTGWVVKVRSKDMAEFYARALQQVEGRPDGMSLEELAPSLRDVLTEAVD